MGRVFNICFQHKGKSYTALVSVNGKDDSPVKVTTNGDTIEIHLPFKRTDPRYPWIVEDHERGLGASR